MKLSKIQFESLNRVAEILELEELRNQAIIVGEDTITARKYILTEKPKYESKMP